MKYLLDTNVCIQYLNRRLQKIIDKLDSQSPEDIVVCSVTRAELRYGAMKSPNRERILKMQNEFLEPLETASFDDAAAEQYGSIRAELEKRGTPIGPNDLMIAAITLSQSYILVTHNTREFNRVEGLQIEDWEL